MRHVASCGWLLAHGIGVASMTYHVEAWEIWTEADSDGWNYRFRAGWKCESVAQAAAEVCTYLARYGSSGARYTEFLLVDKNGWVCGRFVAQVVQREGSGEIEEEKIADNPGDVAEAASPVSECGTVPGSPAAPPEDAPGAAARMGDAI